MIKTKIYLKEFFEFYNYPENAVKEFIGAYEKLEGNENLSFLLENFYKDTSIGMGKVENLMDEAAEVCGVHKYTAKFLFYALLSKELKEVYKKRGFDEQIYIDSMEDLRYKAVECFDVYGVWGFFATTWFYNFFRLECFKLGRLEFEIIGLNLDNLDQNEFTVAGRTIKAGMPVINIHIPSSREPFNKQARLDSYDKAYHFFNDVLGKNIDVFACGSWLLYDKNKEILGEKSNIVDFANDFNILGSWEYKDPWYDMWRIFGKYGTGPIDVLPRETSLQRAYADFISGGGIPGASKGVFVWDDVNKTTLK